MESTRSLSLHKGNTMKTTSTAIAALALATSSLAQPVVNIPPSQALNGTDFPNGATVNVFDGGFIGLSVDLTGGTLNIFGGQVAIGASGISTGFTNSNNEVNIQGGTIGPFFQLFSGTTLNLDGGTMDTFGVFSGSTANVNAGTVQGFPDVFGNGTLNLRGGNVNTIRALSGSNINIYGQSFSLGGSPIEDLEPGTPRILAERNQLLEVTLEDGSAFDWFLRPFDPGFPSPDVALTSATITLHLIETKPPCLPDVNQDGALNGLDFGAWLSAFNANDPRADQNLDGQINGLDFGAWLSGFNAGCE